MAKAKIDRFLWAAMFQRSVRHDLSRIRSYASELQDALDERVTQFKKHVDERARKYDPESREEWYDWNSGEHWELSEVFPAILRHSVFVTTYSFLESTVMRGCRQFARQKPGAIEIRDLRGEGLEVARIYLKKVHGVQFPDQSAEWHRLSYYRKIRNCLVHRDGQVGQEGPGKDIRVFVAKNPDLAVIDERNRLSLRREGCDDMISVTQRFLDLLIDEFRSPKGRKRGAKGRAH